MRKYLLSIPMILLLLVGSASAVTVGQQIADFSLTGLDGGTYKPSDYRGQVLILAVIGWN